MAIGIVVLALSWTTVGAGISYVNFPGQQITARSSIIAVAKAASAEDCIVNCMTTTGCSTVSVQKISNVCQMNNVNPLDEHAVTTDALWKTWFIIF
jgi:hypothetical protein